MVDFQKALEKWKQAGKPEFTESQIQGVRNMANPKLSELSKLWVSAPSIQSQFSNLADGDYLCSMAEMIFAEAKGGSKRWQVTTTFKVEDGEQEGQTCKRFDGVMDVTGMGYFKHVCEVIGLDLPPDMNQWQEHMNAYVESNVETLYDITVKTKGEYSNVFVNGVSEATLGAATEGDVVEEEVAVEEEVVVEEEIPQQVVVPARKATTKPVVKAAAKPVQPTIRRMVAPVPAALARKVVSLRR